MSMHARYTALTPPASPPAAPAVAPPGPSHSPPRPAPGPPGHGSGRGPGHGSGRRSGLQSRNGSPDGAARERNPIARLFLGRTGDPPWARPALWAILVLAGVFYGWNLTSLSGNDYYSAAVVSASESWKAFFFGSLDAGNYITVDKPPLSLWAQALAARAIGGVNSWSLIGPQVLMGVATVAVLYSTVRRAFGHTAAVIAALVLALTPITVAINRDNNPDTLLVLFLVLAAWALQRSLEDGRLRWLIGCAVFVGLAFNTKMLQAALVLPGFALVHLLFAPGGLGRRLGRLLAAGVALVVAGGWWMLIVDLWPSGSRPYIGGSSDNTVWDLVVGYNGLGRVLGASAGTGTGGGANFGGTAGIGRMFNTIMGGQISWLIPFALIALVTGVALRGRARRTDLARAALLLWGGWLVVHYLVFSLSEGGFHPYYVTAMGPAIAALTGAGTVAMFTAARRWAWTLPVALAVTGAWAIVLLNRTPDWNPWLVWVVGAATALGVIGLLAARLGPRGWTRLGVTAATIGLVGALAGPAAYAAATSFSSGDAGMSGTNPTAGPSTGDSGMRGGMPRMSGGTPPSGAPSGMPAGAPTAGTRSGPPSGGGMGGNVTSALVSYLEKNQGDATWLVAVNSAQSASSIILQTGKPVIAMGGFTGSDPAMTLTKLKEYFASGKLRYIILGDDTRGGAGSDITAWVKENLTVVDASDYGGTSSSTGTTLYRYG